MKKRKQTPPRFYATQFALQMVSCSYDAIVPAPAALTAAAADGGGAAAAGDAAGASGESGGSSGLGLAGGAGALECGLIVESNFRVYAYTRSNHVVLLLNLFIRMEYLLPNLAVGAMRFNAMRVACLSPTRRGSQLCLCSRD